jgi:hypothetical protein
MKFVLFVEGHTEKKAIPEFLKRKLDPQLSKPVGIKIVRFEGWQDYVKNIAKKVALNLSGQTGADVIAAIGLLDLFGPTFYPLGKTDAEAKMAWAKEYLETSVDNRRFRQHFAVHELEAWLLASPDGLPDAVRNALPGKCTQPEGVNFDEPPSMLLERLYREKLGRHYKKITDGTNLFRRLEPNAVRAKCPHFKALVDEMFELAKEAGL